MRERYRYRERETERYVDVSKGSGQRGLQGGQGGPGRPELREGAGPRPEQLQDNMNNDNTKNHVCKSINHTVLIMVMLIMVIMIISVMLVMIVLGAGASWTRRAARSSTRWRPRRRRRSCRPRGT